ncbi:MAE_28990/MAE_18760 family HEPN-like nuclease [Corynebacterium segmentosum]|uniref:MAE_28990/MAE_18760 family HEPN-like nuclease n=1 Tax=Corynebacterium segmentosum TaxID=43990 RepID=UPI003B219079
MRDIDELFGALTEASAWRKKELNKLVSKFNFQYRKTTQKDPNNPEKTIVRYQYIEDDSSGRVVPLSALDKRAMYILTYSHWEGYVKQAIQIYLKSLGYVSFREAQSHPRAVRRILRTRLEEHKKPWRTRIFLLKNFKNYGRVSLNSSMMIDWSFRNKK